MSSQDCLNISKWACEIAESYNKPVMYVLMKIHEGFNQSRDIAQMKKYVIAEVERW